MRGRPAIAPSVMSATVPTLPVTINEPHGRLRGLDTLRGIAITMVIIYHVQLHFGAPGLVGQLAHLGYNGVQLFFIVSGITMCYMWSARKSETWETGKFLIRRLCRIAPPFWFAIAFYMAWRQTGLSILEPAGISDVLLTALLVHGFSAHAINLVVPGGWSIAAEVGFYVLFPLMVTRLKSVPQRCWMALVIYLACCFAEYVLLHRYGVDEIVVYYSLLTQLPIFVVAMALFKMLFDAGPRSLRTPIAVAVIWMAIAILGKHLGWPTRPGLWAEVIGMLLFAAVMLKRFEWRFFAFLGRISYSAYLFHFAVIDLLAAWLPHATGFASFGRGLGLVAIGTIAVAWASSRTLEAWAVDLGRHLVRRLDASGLKQNAA
jgi:exopolysaccharide production protein ExoZ